MSFRYGKSHGKEEKVVADTRCLTNTVELLFSPVSMRVHGRLSVRPLHD